MQYAARLLICLGLGIGLGDPVRAVPEAQIQHDFASKIMPAAICGWPKFGALLASLRASIQRKMRSVGFGFVPGFMLAACRDHPVPALHSIVDGSWQSPCIERDDIFRTYRISLEFDAGKNVLRREQYFLDRDCSTLGAELRYSGAYGLMVTNKDYVYRVDLIFNQEEMQALQPDAQILLENVSYCGLQTWTIGQSQAPLIYEAAHCSALGPPPLKNLNLVAVARGRSLVFGIELANENERPQDVNPERPELRFLSNNQL